MSEQPIEWTFESTIYHPDGTRVQVTASVPIGATWSHVAETAELTQMAASRTMQSINKSKESEVPF